MSTTVKKPMMTEKDFNVIKTLVGVGLSAKKITDITKRSSGVISIVNRCGTWEDYQKYREVELARRKAREQVEDTTLTTSSNDSISEQDLDRYRQKLIIKDYLREINERLKRVEKTLKEMAPRPRRFL